MNLAVTDGLLIRRATQADLPAVGRLGALLMRAHFDFDPDRFMRPGPDAEQGYAWFLGAQLTAEESIVLVAERGGEVVGYLCGAVEPASWKDLRDRAGYIHDVFVNEDCRGQGIAEALMPDATAWLRMQGVPRVLLGAAAQNQQAQRLFQRLGFRRTMIEMTKELD